MNIIEATKTGKKIRRAGWTFFIDDPQYFEFKREDVLANDWEVEEKKVTITEAEFDGIVEHILAILLQLPVLVLKSLIKRLKWK